MQNLAVSVYGIYWKWLRFGSGNNKLVEEYTARNDFTLVEWDSWQRDRLVKLLQDAVTKVPYYRENWTGVEKTAALNGELEDLPLLEKEPIRSNPAAFVRNDFGFRYPLRFHTSGSTGTPIVTVWTIDELRASLAVREARSTRWAGVSFRLPRATFSGRIVEPDPKSDGPFYRYNAAERQVYFSAFHLRPDTADQYVATLRKYKVEWLTGYAVSWFLLAKFILQNELEVPPLKAVVTTSEKVTSEMRAVMRRAYKCRVFEEYGTVENAIFASECEHGRLHYSPDVSIVEILRPNRTKCCPNEPGEVVVTTLMRQCQPFIRYRLGDIAAWDADRCPCGRAMPVLKEVVGRIEDIVIGPDGRSMVRFHGIFVDQPHVLEGQIIQEKIDWVRVKVVPSNGFCDRDVREIVRRMHQRLSDKVRIDVETVDCIPRTRSGKFQAVISRLKNNGIGHSSEAR